MTKQWYTSKMLWINAVGIIAIIIQTQFGYVIDVELQAAALPVINMILRAVTNEEIVWSKA